ncbi:uncharacterized protein CEXT_641301 [Caerostris extrusa]|uniref:Uncharacterized protein n=1 Tax=Caerostris extrusa TaxID=172846 RepID=A0AAV4Y5K1_CAEEX|nr:uncharacterized protein CEXT_641301 [Caerostris extrusa]
MVRRNSKRLLKLVLTICAAVVCGGLLLKAAISSLELQASVMVDRSEVLHSRLNGVSRLTSKDPLKKSWYEATSVAIPPGPGEKVHPSTYPRDWRKLKKNCIKKRALTPWSAILSP